MIALAAAEPVQPKAELITQLVESALRSAHYIVTYELRKCHCPVGRDDCDSCNRALADYESTIRWSESIRRRSTSMPTLDEGDQFQIIERLLAHMAKRSPQFNGLALYEGDARRMEEIRRAVFG